MKVIEEVKLNEVWDYWKKIEGFTNDDFRSDIRALLPDDIKWHEAWLETEDISRCYVISSDDWRNELLCVPDFKLTTAIFNYQNSKTNIGKYNNIKQKEIIYNNDINALDKKFIFVAPDISGPFTIIEGNKRAVALGSLGKLNNIEIYLGLSRGIINYNWARYSK